MWGTFVEGQINEATKKCKTDAEAERKVTMVMLRVFRDTPADEQAGLRPVQSAPVAFRDPAARYGKG